MKLKPLIDIHTHEPKIESEPQNEPEKFVCGSQYFNCDFNEASQDVSFFVHTFDILPELKNMYRIKIKEVTKASCSAAWERERELKTEKTFILDAVRALQDVCMTYIFP